MSSHPIDREHLVTASDDRGEVEERVIAKIRKRRDSGRRKYSKTMERQDLEIRDWLKHAQEEAMDLTIYLQKLIDSDIS